MEILVMLVFMGLLWFVVGGAIEKKICAMQKDEVDLLKRINSIMR